MANFGTYPYGAQGYVNPYGAPNYGYQPQYQPQAQMPVQSPQASPQQPAQPQMQVQSNKIFVTSIEDAMTRMAMPNSEVVYLHQDKPLLFEIRTDAQGKKTPFVYDIVPHREEQPKEQPKVDYVSREEFDGLYEQIKEIRGTIESLATRRKKSNEPIE